MSDRGTLYTTVREHLEAIRDNPNVRGAIFYHAVEALTMLEKADRVYVKGNGYGDYCCDCGTAIRFHSNWPGGADDVHGRFVPDPEVSDV